MKKLSDLIEKHNLPLIYQSYTPDQIIEKLSFEKSMYLAYQMFCNKERDDNLYNFAADLLQHIRQKYQQEWELNWRHDFFLGDVCYFTMRFDESYQAYKRASLKFHSNMSPSLLVSLAGCYSTPGLSPISIYRGGRKVG